MQIGINVPEQTSPVRIIPERGAQAREGTIDNMRHCRDGVLSKRLRPGAFPACSSR